ncbi:hypothetical protein E2C01_055758 [Portunus trituberculatus]|uniref:Uncharacterized protein n=1 Tax=Portunus trituberculatus TaxID=210409 RepID=A0A5B7GVL6_PORTR|nr:hypothetical protein [Portunus trituberculatus]
MSLGRYQELVSGEKEDDFLGLEEHFLESSPTFIAMMDLVCEKFPEAHGPVVQDSTPLLPAMQRSVTGTVSSWAHATPTIVDQARITAFALANTRVARRESYLSHLPHQFSLACKAQLCLSDVDSDLLFKSTSVEKAIGFGFAH